MTSSQAIAPERDRSVGILLATLGGMLGPLMPFVPRAPTLIALVGALGGAVLLWRRGSRLALPDRALLWIIAGLLAWTLLSALWAIDAVEALGSTAKLAGNLAVGMVLVAVAGGVTSGEARLAGRTLAIGCVLAVAIVSVEMLTGAPLSARFVAPQYDANLFAAQLSIYGAYWFNAAVSLLTLMIWPLLANARHLPKVVHVIAPTAVVLLAIAIGFSSGALAVVAGSCAALLVWRGGRWGRYLLAASLALAILIGPVLPRTIFQPDQMSELAGMPTQDLPRFYIWAFAAERIAERPLLGWGMNASRSMPGGKAQIIDNIRDQNYGEAMPLHPHNIALQAWLELGVVGALLIAGLIARLILFGTAPVRAPHVAASAAGLTVTAFVQFALSYGAWQSWWLSSVFLATAFLTAAARVDSCQSSRRHKRQA